MLKKISKVEDKKKLDLWIIKDACDLRIKELKKDVAPLKRDTLYIDTANLSCESSLEGEAYTCQK